MKALTLAALLFVTPALAGETAPAQSGNVVREFVTNNDSTDWTLDPGWSWSGGVLTHWPTSDAGAAGQINTPPLTPGRQYRIEVGFTGRTQGSVSIAFGGTSASNYGQNGLWPLLPVVTDPNAPLTFTATPDFDGTISKVSIVELGDELIDQSAWTLPNGWSHVDGGLRYAADALPIEQALDLVPGRFYRVYFSLMGVSGGHEDSAVGAVLLGGSAARQFGFGPRGESVYELDLAVGDDNRLVLSPPAAEASSESSGGTISGLSVREILSDPVSSQ